MCVTRIAQELASLSAALPLELSSSLFIRADEDNIQLLKCLITGPDGIAFRAVYSALTSGRGGGEGGGGGDKHNTGLS